MVKVTLVSQPLSLSLSLRMSVCLTVWGGLQYHPDLINMTEKCSSVDDISQISKPFPCSLVHQTSAQSLNASPLAWCEMNPEV